ncbi:DUF4912 domain-containing protein [Alicyclobacillus curvatus]|nr:DUF4912 domain-containing protein [Alicyclobacillus curvatus]
MDHAYQPINGRRDLYDEHWDRKTFQNGVLKNRMVGMPVNPSRLFIYWSVDDERRSLIAYHFMCSWHTLPLCLCLYDVTDCWFDGYNAPMLEEHSVHSEADNWYFENLVPGRNYVVHLGTTICQPMFTILRSNVVSLPPTKGADTRQILRFAQLQLQQQPYRDAKGGREAISHNGPGNDNSNDNITDNGGHNDKSHGDHNDKSHGNHSPSRASQPLGTYHYETAFDGYHVVEP